MREMTVTDNCRELRGNDFVVWAQVLGLCDMFIVGQLTREMNWLHYLDLVSLNYFRENKTREKCLGLVLRPHSLRHCTMEVVTSRSL